MLRQQCWMLWILARGRGARKCAMACGGRGRSLERFWNKREPLQGPGKQIPECPWHESGNGRDRDCRALCGREVRGWQWRLCGWLAGPALAGRPMRLETTRKRRRHSHHRRFLVQFKESGGEG